MSEQLGQGPFNIVLFGETGAGKSSVINMLLGTEKAITSNQAVGCTTNSQSYDLRIEDKLFRIWDTAGLNEASKGTVPSGTALDELVRLFEHLMSDEAGGLHLLLYCIAGFSFRPIMRVNYDLVWGIMCQMKVPLVFVVTKQENALGGRTSQRWWKANQHQFTYRHRKDKHDPVQKAISVTATKGKNDVYADDYSQSSKDMAECLLSAVRNPEPFARKIDQNWFSSGGAKEMMDQYLDKLQKGTNHQRDVLNMIRKRSKGPGRVRFDVRKIGGYLTSLLCPLRAVF